MGKRSSPLESMVADSKDTIIIGGGLSGIGYLYKNENSFLIEKSNKLFGHAQSVEFENFFFDQGAHICHSKNEEWKKLINLKESNKLNSSSVSNTMNGKWIGYPVQNNLKDIENKDKALSEIKENLGKKPRSDNYENWCKDVYGNYLTQEYYKKFTNKYWRTPMNEMNTDWLGGRILNIDFDRVISGYDGKSEPQAVFSEYYYPKKGGFEALFSNIKKNLKHESYVLNSEVVKADFKNKILKLASGKEYSYKKLISTIPITELIKISDLDINTNDLKYNNLILTGVVSKGSNEYYPDWFYVYDEDIEFSRVMNISKIQKKSREMLALQFETFRRCDEKYDSIELIKKIEEDICKFMSKKKNDLKIFHKHIKYSYVVPTHGVQKKIQEIKNQLKIFDVHSIGLYGNWEYVWSDNAFMQGFKYE